MHTLHLVIGLALSLLLPVVHSGDALVPLDRDAQDRIVDLYNEGRADVDPEGANIQKMYWSDELAEIAAGHALSCSAAPNVNRNRLSKKFAVVGENIGLSLEVQAANIFTLINYWFSEERFYDYQSGECGYLIEGFDTCDHYLQAVYAGTCEVGCAIASCPYQLTGEFSTYLDFLGDDNLRQLTRYLVVCNYGPGNPDPSQPPYIQGAACTRCPDEYPLCTNSTEEGDKTRTRTRTMTRTTTNMGTGTRTMTNMGTGTGTGTRTMTNMGTGTRTGSRTTTNMGTGTRTGTAAMTATGTGTMTNTRSRRNTPGEPTIPRDVDDDDDPRGQTGTRETGSGTRGQTGTGTRGQTGTGGQTGQTGTGGQTGQTGTRETGTGMRGQTGTGTRGQTRTGGQTGTRETSGRTTTTGGMSRTRRPYGLCYNEEEMCLGSDPHFAIRLPGGQLLCYTFQGAHNTTFNLVSNRQLEMNALFVPDQTNWDNTWLGAIGMTVLHDGKKRATLQFTAADQRVQVGETTPIAAHSIKKISSHKGRLTMVRFPPGHIPRYPRVQVELKDTDVNFTVAFTKRNHLDLHWHSAGEPFEDSKGVVGQFFRQGVKVDVDSELLHLPGRPTVPVERKPLWKFMKHSFHRDTKCWTSLYSSSQGAGIVEGSYEDYIVDGLLAVEL